MLKQKLNQLMHLNLSYKVIKIFPSDFIRLITITIKFTRVCNLNLENRSW